MGKMIVRNCAMPYCPFKSEKWNYRFPTVEERKRKWMEATRLTNANSNTDILKIVLRVTKVPI